ncbi:Eisosome component PIL1-domain-containing protein [Lophiotrema nucula]|uniref:Eisosome component PIL1-domain-containing protein n=1 Tax=Lophiotrema nucula TaxID=690887 RepID=A0A6A5Z6Z3_9PLEO|nr:Eisosome component PIL1-domain-containing protein [Lophiotrema nucula]
MPGFTYPTNPPPPPPPPPAYPGPPSRSNSRAPSLTRMPSRIRNRSLSIRSKKDGSGGGLSEKSVPKHRFTMASLRGIQQPDLSKKLYKLIKSENHAIGAYESAGRERISIAQQLSEWGEATGDDAISEISDKLGVLMAEIAEQEDMYAQSLEEYRSVLKSIRNTESSVQPSRDHKQKVSDEIAKLKYKEPQSTKIVQLEQELVRAEAQSLVAEAQLTNITRQKFKEAFDIHFAGTIERAEKQIILAKQARRMLNLLDDTPIVPGDQHPVFNGTEATRQVLNEAEDELRAWQPNIEPITSNAGSLGAGAMPGGALPSNNGYGSEVGHQDASLQEHPAYREKSRSRSTSGDRERRVASGGSLGSNVGGSVQPPYPMSEVERREMEQAGQI